MATNQTVCKGTNCSEAAAGFSFAAFLKRYYGIVIPAIIVALVLVIWVVQQIRKRLGDNRQEFRMFTVKELIEATDNFSENRLIGKGGQASVYEGRLSGNRKVAIKKPSIMDEQAMKQFDMEVNALSKIRHAYVVKLLGCCEDRSSPYLVYEYISNGDLHSLLFDYKKSRATPWNVRHRIAVKVAEGLQHLHFFNVLHRDIKGQNILLNDQLDPKIADFGLSKVYSADNEEFRMASLTRGTFGFICPQFCRDGIFKPSSDIFSYGVLLIQMMTGLPAVIKGATPVSLAVHFRKVLKDDGLEGILAHKVAQSNERTKVVIREVAKLAKKCVHMERDKRPLLPHIVQVLVNLEAGLPENNYDGTSSELVPILPA